jgi:ribonuclease P protein component
VAKLGRKWAVPGVMLQCAPRPADVPPGNCPRVGFTASRKVGGAVQRNRARRRLRAAAQAVLPEQARLDRDFVLIARAGTAARPFSALLQDLQTAIGKVGGRLDGETGAAS